MVWCLFPLRWEYITYICNFISKIIHSLEFSLYVVNNIFCLPYCLYELDDFNLFYWSNLYHRSIVGICFSFEKFKMHVSEISKILLKKIFFYNLFVKNLFQHNFIFDIEYFVISSFWNNGHYNIWNDGYFLGIFIWFFRKAWAWRCCLFR